MDLDIKLTASKASPEAMDLLSSAWCSSALQAFQTGAHDCSMTLKETLIMPTENDEKAASLKKDDIFHVDDVDLKSVPPSKFNDLKSWIWLQQAIHPELDYDMYYKKKWFTPKTTPWKIISITKWLKEIKQKRKEEERLQRAEVHAAISIAGVAAALAAIAAENIEHNQLDTSKETAMASAAALVAAQCAQVAGAVGAKREQLSSAISAAMAATDASDIITLTAAAATSLRGAATLRGRPGRRERIKRSAHTLLFDELDFDFGKCRASLAKGDNFLVGTPDGKYKLRSVSVVLNKEAKVIIKIKKINMLMAFSSARESILYDLQTSPQEKSIEEADPYYPIDITTCQGIIELKLDDYVQYKKWIMTINRMLMLSTTVSGYETPML